MRISIFVAAVALLATCAPAAAQVGGIEWQNAGVRVCNTFRANATNGGITCASGVATLPFATSSTVTLPNAYTNGTAGPQVITLDSTRLGIRVRNSAVEIGTSLFAVTNNAASTAYLNVAANGITTATDISVTGDVSLQNAGTVSFCETTANGTDCIQVGAPSSVPALWKLSLPTTDGDSGQVLRTNGIGATTWVSGGGDLSGTLDAASVVGLGGTAISGSPVTNGQLMLFNGTNWTPSQTLAGTYSGTYTIGGTPTLGADLAMSADNARSIGAAATTALAVYTREVASRTPATGAGVNLDLSAGDAGSGNTNGGDVDLNIGNLSGTGVVGFMRVRNAADTGTLFRVTQTDSATNGLVEIVGAATATVQLRPATDNVALLGGDANRWFATFSGAYAGIQQTPAFSATPAWNANTGGETIRVTLTGNITSWTATNGSLSQQWTLILCQDATGSRTWAGGPSNVTFSGGMPALTTTASTCDVFTFRWDDANSRWRETGRALNQSV